MLARQRPTLRALKHDAPRRVQRVPTRAVGEVRGAEHIRSEDGLHLRCNGVPDILPQLAGTSAECTAVTLPYDGNISVVIQVDEVWPPPDGHRESGCSGTSRPPHVATAAKGSGTARGLGTSQTPERRRPSPGGSSKQLRCLICRSWPGRTTPQRLKNSQRSAEPTPACGRDRVPHS
jgi:hypothetical protein